LLAVVAAAAAAAVLVQLLLHEVEDDLERCNGTK
jgi:hypothetical protein